MNMIVSFLPFAAILISVWLMIKKPRTASTLSRSMGIAMLAFCVLAYFGNSIATKEDEIFWTGFALLTIYCITIVPFLMHLTSAIRQRKKLEQKEANKDD